MTYANESAPTVASSRGAETSAGERLFLTVKSASRVELLQYRLSAFALALDAVLPGLAYLQHITEVATRGDRMPGDAPARLYRLALQLHDLRNVLEAPMPEVTG